MIMQRINVTIKIDDEMSEDEGSCIVGEWIGSITIAEKNFCFINSIIFV